MTKNKLKLGFLAVLAIGMAGVASAANLTWTADYTVDLSSPDVNLTIVSDSEAETLVVNTGNIQVSIADGDTFIVTSADRNLTVTGTTSADVSIDCAAGEAIVTIVGGADEETLTITPTASACVSSGGGGGGGGGGGSSPSPSPAPSPAPTTTTTTTTTTAPVYCNAGQTFNTSTGERCTAVTPTTSTSSTTSTTSSTTSTTVTAPAFVWTRNLTLGSVGEDVRQLQIYLNTHGFAVATFGAGAPGFETFYFGLKTQAALARWQASLGITPAVGFLGPISRARLNAMASVVGVFPAGCSSTAGFSVTTGQSCFATYPAGCSSSAGFSVTTGRSCSATYPAGCASTAGFSVTTGQSCAAPTSTTTTTTTTTTNP